MFHGFPHISQNHDPIKISTGRSHPPAVVQIQAKLLTEVTSPQGGRKYLEDHAAYMEDPMDLYAIVVDTENSHQVHPLDTLANPKPNPWRLRTAVQEANEPSSVLLRPHTPRNHGAWDTIALTSAEEQLVEALRIIEPLITQISSIGDDRPGDGRITAVRMSNKPRPIPLMALGEGINRVYDIIVTMLTMPKGIILIDQFDDGLSEASQEELWRTVFRIARNRGTQAFATTHNEPAAEAFRKIARESPEEAKFTRLEKSGGKHIHVSFNDNPEHGRSGPDRE